MAVGKQKKSGKGGKKGGKKKQWVNRVLWLILNCFADFCFTDLNVYFSIDLIDTTYIFGL